MNIWVKMSLNQGPSADHVLNDRCATSLGMYGSGP